MQIVVINRFLNNLSAGKLSFLFVLSGLMAGFFEGSASLLGQVAYFTLNFILLTVLLIWPLSIRNSLTTPEQGNLLVKVTNVAVLIIYLLVLTSPVIKVATDFDLRAFLEGGSVFGTIVFFAMWLTVHGLFFSFYFLSVKEYHDAFLKFFLGLKYIFLFVFFPVGIFFIQKDIEKFKRLENN